MSSLKEILWNLYSNFGKTSTICFAIVLSVLPSIITELIGSWLVAITEQHIMNYIHLVAIGAILIPATISFIEIRKMNESNRY